MRYCKYRLGSGAMGYALVEEREGELWAVAPMEAPEEDLKARLEVLGSKSGEGFTPTPLSKLSLLAPVTPSKIVCVGRNYRDHATELGNEVPKEPLLFLKPPSSLLGSGGEVRMPALSKRVDYEGELGIVIGRRCSKIGEGEDVRTYIRGYV